MAYFKNEFRSVLYVDDFEASTKFYGEGLELRSNYSWDDGPDDRGVKYLAAGGVIEVIRRDPPIAQGSTTLMLEAEDVNACYRAMKKKDWLVFWKIWLTGHTEFAASGCWTLIKMIL